jgi:hypothetical protein
MIEKVLFIHGKKHRHVRIKCATCKKVFWQRKSRYLRNKHSFCSRECHINFSKVRTTQSCRICKETQPIENFGWNKKDISKKTICKTCAKKESRKYYYANIDTQRAQALIRAKRNRYNLRNKFNHYLTDKKCIKCGIADPVVLEFHHHHNDKAYNIASMIIRGFGWERILAEIKKCDILCANCHRKQTALDYNWSKSRGS